MASAAALAAGGATLEAAQKPKPTKPKVRLRSKDQRVDVTFAVQRGAVDSLKQALRGIEAHQPFLLIAYGVLFDQLRAHGTVSTEFEFKIWLAKQPNNDLV